MTTRQNRTLLLLAIVCANGIVDAAELKVDLNPPERRTDILTPHWENWAWTEGHSGSKTFDRVTVTFSAAASNAALSHVWFKGLLDYGATMASDGISVKDPASDGGIDMVISGLMPGKHTIVTYHSEVRDVVPMPLNVFVGDALKIKGLMPTRRATNDYDAANAFLEVDAVTGQEVVIRFRPESMNARPAVVINSFEIDTANPATKAIKPSPANDDEHANAESGSVQLTWTSPASAMLHDVFFGTNVEAVARADHRSPLFRGREADPTYRIANLNHFDTYYWRVDEIDALNKLTKGEIWRFRTRHLAFPIAEGYGRFARGGRGGRVIEVTNLDDVGAGSLRAAVEAEGPRTVVFNVSGLITLESKLVIKNPYLTIAGQTAPGEGICVRKYNMGLSGTHNVIVRHVRVRPGNIAGVTLDGMGMAGSDHCIIDHCSISWSHDEAFSSRSAKNITLQRTLISEALNEAGHKKYPPGTQHGYAASISGLIGSFHHNLLAHCAGRNWSLAGGLNQGARHTGWLDIRNNVVYNWKHRTTDGGAAKVNFVNNYYKPGPASKYFSLLNPERNNIKGFGPQDYYVAGNVMEGRHQANQPLSGVTQPEPYKNFIVDAPFFESYVQTQSAEGAYTNVLADVGCNRPTLDDHDKRVIQEARDGTYKYRGSKTGLPGLPDSQEDVGGWEDYPEVRRPADWDTDHDGLPDEWEKRHGLKPNDPADGNQDCTGDGYTNLEKYLNSLVGEYSMPETKSRN